MCQPLAEEECRPRTLLAIMPLRSTLVTTFASRASTHLPFCFLRTDSVWPARAISGAPPGGVTTTDSFVQINARSLLS